MWTDAAPTRNAAPSREGAEINVLSLLLPLHSPSGVSHVQNSSLLAREPKGGNEERSAAQGRDLAGTRAGKCGEQQNQHRILFLRCAEALFGLPAACLLLKMCFNTRRSSINLACEVKYSGIFTY